MSTEIEKLQQSVQSLEMKIQQLSMPYEDILSHRVFDSTKKKIYSYFSVLAVIATVVLTISGYKAYKEIVSNTTKIVVDDLSSRVRSKVEKISDKIIQDRINKAVDDYSLQARDNLDRDMNDSRKRIEEQFDIKLNEALQEIGSRLKDKQFAKVTQKAMDNAISKEQQFDNGWVFYGRKNSEGEWKGFFTTNGVLKNQPSTNDRIKARVEVNLRENFPDYSEADGWFYPPTKDVISIGEEVIIQDTKTIKSSKGQFYWVRVNRNTLIK